MRAIPSVSQEIVDVDRTAHLERGVVVAQHLEHLAAPVRDLLLAALESPFGGLGGRCLPGISRQKNFTSSWRSARLTARSCSSRGGQRVELLERGHGSEVIRGPGAPNR